ncbi:nitrilase-related carbon-nitrogen hydrolase [Streptomyces sp. LZ34]
MYTLLANHVGTTGGWNTCGASAVWDPTGRLVAEAGPTEQELVVADLDPEHLLCAREAHTMLADFRDAYCTDTHSHDRVQVIDGHPGEIARADAAPAPR